MQDKIKTTINIKPYLKKMVYDVAVAYDVTMNEIVTLIILKIVNKLKNNPDYNPKLFTSVKYQEKYKPLKWDILHVSYDPGVYEVANDLRRIIKKTVSKYIAEGIEEFLGEIVKDLLKNLHEKKEEKTSDNYFPNYSFTRKNHKKTPSFTIFWGIPILKIPENYIIE